MALGNNATGTQPSILFFYENRYLTMNFFTVKNNKVHTSNIYRIETFRIFTVSSLCVDQSKSTVSVKDMV